MLREICNVRQIAGEPQRRWFSSDTLDLVVWNDAEGKALGFQFCYDKGKAEHALRWDAATGFRYLKVDDGESGGGLHYKAAPVMLANGKPDLQYMMDCFRQGKAELPEEILAVVGSKLGEYRQQLLEEANEKK